MNRIIEKLNNRYISKTKKNQEIFILRFLVHINKSGPEGVEPSTRSFGDFRSTAELRPYFCYVFYTTDLEIFNFFTLFEIQVSGIRRYNSITQNNCISFVLLAIDNVSKQ